MIEPCRQKDCQSPAWPGSDESFVCEKHSVKVRAVADALGMYIQLIAIPAPASAGGAQ